VLIDEVGIEAKMNDNSYESKNFKHNIKDNLLSLNTIYSCK